MKLNEVKEAVRQTYEVPTKAYYTVWTHESDGITTLLTDEQVCRMGFPPYDLPKWKDANSHQRTLILILRKVI